MASQIPYSRVVCSIRESVYILLKMLAAPSDEVYWWQDIGDILSFLW